MCTRHCLCKGLSTLAWQMPTWVQQMSVATTGLPDEWLYKVRPTSKSKPCVPRHETDTGSTKVVLEEGEQVFVKWPPDITIKKFGVRETPDCWNELKEMAESQGVVLSLRTYDRRSKYDRQMSVPAGARPLQTSRHYACLRIIGPKGTTMAIYTKMREVLKTQMGTWEGLIHPRKIELLEKSFDDEQWRKPSTGRSCTLAKVEEEMNPDSDDSPDEDAPSTDENSITQAPPTEASPVGGATASQPTETPRANGSFPPTVPACNQEQSKQWLDGFTGFCEYATWRLEVDTQNCEFVSNCCCWVC